jgi:hypothetical protein
MEITIFPLTKDTIGVRVGMFLPILNLEKEQIEVKLVFNHSTQEVRTVYNAFGG